MINKEINKLEDSIEHTPGRGAGALEKKVAHERSVCEKAPDFVEHYRMEDDDLPCDDGRTGDV